MERVVVVVVEVVMMSMRMGKPSVTRWHVPRKCPSWKDKNAAAAVVVVAIEKNI